MNVAVDENGARSQDVVVLDPSQQAVAADLTDADGVIMRMSCVERQVVGTVLVGRDVLHDLLRLIPELEGLVADRLALA